MNRIVVFAVSAVVALTAQAAKIEQIIVRQQWPWSTDIKVEYRLSGLEAGRSVDLVVKAYDGGVELDASRLAQSIKGAVHGIVKGQEVGSFTIDPINAFGGDKVAIADFSVKLSAVDTPATMEEVLYRVYDLDDGSVESVTRMDLLNGKKGSIVTDYRMFGADMVTPSELAGDFLVWTEVTNNPIYKTSKLVMRKIPAGGKVWLCGDPEGSLKNGLGLVERKYVKLTQDYFVGVFEITQAQFQKIQGNNPSSFNAASDAVFRPVEMVARPDVHGNHNKATTAAYRGVLTGEIVCWPTNSILHDVGKTTFMANMRSKTGVEFDFPTAAQWEFACGAYSATALYSGVPQSQEALNVLSWNNSNSDGETHPVGLKAPNGFGLYDMLGNVAEFVHNIGPSPVAGASSGDGSSADNPAVDPIGSDDVVAMIEKNEEVSNRQVRGGSYSGMSGTWQDHRTAGSCGFYAWWDKHEWVGFRVVCPVDAQWPR